MSVPASKRSISEFEFYNTAIRLRQHVTFWLLRDFGAKPRVRDAKFVATRYQMTDEDKKTFEELLAKYNIGDSVCDTYPQWWIQERRRKIDGLLTETIECIVRAFNLYATTLEEYNERRRLQSKAITGIYAVLEECQFVISVLYKTGGVDVDRYGQLVQFCDDELALLKGWRKQGNKQREGIIRKERRLRQKIDSTSETESRQKDAV